MKKLIFIFDDDVQVMEFYQIVLEAAGYQVKTFFSLQNIIELTEQGQPDLLILDVMFATDKNIISDGIDAARILKDNEKTKHIPILSVSGINVISQIQNQSEKIDKDPSWFPVDEFADKPIKPKKLVQIVQKLTGVKNAGGNNGNNK